MMPMGGLLVLAVGLGMVIGGFCGRRALMPTLIAGFLLGGLCQGLYAGSLSRQPTLPELVVLGGAILFEFLLIGAIFGVNQGQRDARNFWLWLLFGVGLHFVPLGYVHGPLMIALGVCCIMSAVVGLMAPKVSFLVFWTLDGVLKMLFGGFMVLMAMT